MRYRVIFEPFAERHFIKSFFRKHQGAWDRTRRVLELEFAVIDSLFEKTIVETIYESPDTTIRICKTEFKIIGTQHSRHASGNRCIISIHTDTATVRVLLVYAKTDVKGSHETAWWQGLIKENYSEYKDCF